MKLTIKKSIFKLKTKKEMNAKNNQTNKIFIDQISSFEVSFLKYDPNSSDV